MSLIVSTNAGSIPMKHPGNAANQPNQDSRNIKEKAIDKLETTKEQMDNRADHINARKNERLQAMEEYTREQGYAHLATRLNVAIETVNAIDRRVEERREQRFDRAEQLIEHRPQGGYNMSQQKAESIISEIDRNTDSLTSALANRSAVIGERYANLEQKLIDMGHDGSRMSALGEKLDAHIERTVERVESRSERAIDRIHGRIESGYGPKTETERIKKCVISS